MLKGSQKPMSEKLKKYVVNPETGCWEWTGSKDRDGYGRIAGSFNNKRTFSFAHRESYKLHVGPIGEEGGEFCQVLHRCDNPSCINPEHLYLGDPAQNGKDKTKRGRAKGGCLVGEANPMFGRTGPLNPFFGKTHTEESKQKMRESLRKVKDNHS